MNQQPTHTVLTPDQEPGVARERPRRRWLWVIIIVVVLGAALVIWHTRTAPASGGSSATTNPRARGAMVIPVVGAKAQQGDIAVQLTGLGGVTPIYTVTVKTRVDGQLMKILYTEGQIVRQGQLLAEIDRRPYEVQLTQAEGQLAKDQSALDNARIDLTRYESLAPHNAVPQQTVETQKALVRQYEGTVKTDEGQVASAKLNLMYCQITAPFTGRVGLRLVDPGNIVHASDQNGLLVITQVQPISVIFTIAEVQLPAVLHRMMAGQRLRVAAYDHDNRTKLADGTLSTLDNQIDPTTGTLKLRATFDNRDNALFPNQFVNVRLLVEEKHGVTTVATAAIQRNSDTTYVYLVKPDSTVTVRSVKLGTTEGDQTEITSGLSPGDVVVMVGVDKLQEGSKVIVHFPGEKPPRAS